MSIISDFASWFTNLISREPSTEEKIDQIQDEYEKSLSKIRRSVADITTEKKSLEMRRSEIESNIQDEKEKARDVMEDDEEEARRILKRRARNQERVESLSSKISELEDIRQRLIWKKEEISSNIQEIRTKRINMRARKKTTKARRKVSETLSDVSYNSIESSLESTQEYVDRLESRAEVHSSSTTTGVEENIERELEDMR